MLKHHVITIAISLRVCCFTIPVNQQVNSFWYFNIWRF